MTCIVGIVDNGTVYIGGDSAGSNPTQIVTRVDSKVFRVGEFLFGCCGSFRMTQLLRHALVIPVHPDTMPDEEYIVIKFIEAARAVFEAGGFTKKYNESEWGGDFLVGYRGHLYHVEADFQAGETAVQYDAAGCGDDVALGVLYVTKGMLPTARIQLALEASEFHNIGVRAPFTILSVHKDERVELPPERVATGEDADGEKPVEQPTESEEEHADAA